LLSELEDELGVALVGPHGRPTPAAVGLAEAVRTALRSIDDFFPAADRSRGESLPANVLPFSCPSAAHLPGSRATELRGPVEGRTAGHRCTARGGA
jgi:DNA-binding transcriptional LysR family regulator